MTNYTASNLSWTPNKQFEGQFEQIKGIIVFMASSFIILGLVILKLIKLYNTATKSSPRYFESMQEKILEMESSLDELLTRSSKSTRSEIKRSVSFDPHVCSICPPTTTCYHDVCDGACSGDSSSAGNSSNHTDYSSELDENTSYKNIR